MESNLIRSTENNDIPSQSAFSSRIQGQPASVSISYQTRNSQNFDVSTAEKLLLEFTEYIERQKKSKKGQKNSLSRNKSRLIESSKSALLSQPTATSTPEGIDFHSGEAVISDDNKIAMLSLAQNINADKRQRGDLKKLTDIRRLNKAVSGGHQNRNTLLPISFTLSTDQPYKDSNTIEYSNDPATVKDTDGGFGEMSFTNKAPSVSRQPITSVVMSARQANSSLNGHPGFRPKSLLEKSEGSMKSFDHCGVQNIKEAPERENELEVELPSVSHSDSDIANLQIANNDLKKLLGDSQVHNGQNSRFRKPPLGYENLHTSSASTDGRTLTKKKLYTHVNNVRRDKNVSPNAKKTSRENQRDRNLESEIFAVLSSSFNIQHHVNKKPCFEVDVTESESCSSWSEQYDTQTEETFRKQNENSQESLLDTEDEKYTRVLLKNTKSLERGETRSLERGETRNLDRDLEKIWCKYGGQDNLLKRSRTDLNRFEGESFKDSPAKRLNVSIPLRQDTKVCDPNSYCYFKRACSPQPRLTKTSQEEVKEVKACPATRSHVRTPSSQDTKVCDPNGYCYFRRSRSPQPRLTKTNPEEVKDKDMFSMRNGIKQLNDSMATNGSLRIGDGQNAHVFNDCRLCPGFPSRGYTSGQSSFSSFRDSYLGPKPQFYTRQYGQLNPSRRLWGAGSQYTMRGDPHSDGDRKPPTQYKQPVRTQPNISRNRSMRETRGMNGFLDPRWTNRSQHQVSFDTQSTGTDETSYASATSVDSLPRAAILKHRAQVKEIDTVNIGSVNITMSNIWQDMKNPIKSMILFLAVCYLALFLRATLIKS